MTLTLEYRDVLNAAADPWEVLEQDGNVITWVIREVTGGIVPVTDNVCQLGEFGCGKAVDVNTEPYALDRVSGNSNFGFQTIHTACIEQADRALAAL